MPSPKVRRGPEGCDVIDNHALMALINAVASNYWWKLPPHVRAWYGVDDMVSECLLRLIWAFPRYRSDRASQSTFIYTAARNQCREICEHYRAQKRTGVMVSVEDQVFLHSPNLTKYRESTTAVEAILAEASDLLLDFLSCIYTGNAEVAKTILDRNRFTLQTEMQRLAKKHSATLNDFVLVLKSPYFYVAATR